jgi:hypothetical protein
MNVTDKEKVNHLDRCARRRVHFVHVFRREDGPLRCESDEIICARYINDLLSEADCRDRLRGSVAIVLGHVEEEEVARSDSRCLCLANPDGTKAAKCRVPMLVTSHRRSARAKLMKTDEISG